MNSVMHELDPQIVVVFCTTRKNHAHKSDVSNVFKKEPIKFL